MKNSWVFVNSLIWQDYTEAPYFRKYRNYFNTNLLIKVLIEEPSLDPLSSYSA